MPDFVVIDEDTKKSWLVEVKYRSFKKYFNARKTNIAFKYGHLKDYLDLWKEAILIFNFNVNPFCLCVDLAKVNWNIHFKKIFENGAGKLEEAWNFYGIYRFIYERFPRVTKDNLEKTLHILNINR